MKRLHGVDYIKALMSVFVVVWHLGGGGFTVMGDKEHYQQHLYSFADFFSFQILLLAVPLFMLTSNFLFLSRDPNKSKLKAVLRRYFLLLIFWAVLSHLYFGGYEEIVSQFPKQWSQVVPFILTGGNTLYYFIVSLMITQLVGYMYTNAGTRLIGASLLLSCAAILAIPLLEIEYSIPRISVIWNPMNFLPYPFIAILLARYTDWISGNRIKITVVLLLLTAACTVFEWTYYRNATFGYPPYTRLSLVTGSAIVMIFALDLRIQSNRVVRFMSDHSLGLYSLHRFVRVPLFPVIYRFLLLVGGKILAPDMLMRWVTIIIVVLISYVFSIALKLVLRDEVI